MMVCKACMGLLDVYFKKERMSECPSSWEFLSTDDGLQVGVFLKVWWFEVQYTVGIAPLVGVVG